MARRELVVAVDMNQVRALQQAARLVLRHAKLIRRSPRAQLLDDLQCVVHRGGPAAHPPRYGLVCALSTSLSPGGKLSKTHLERGTLLRASISLARASSSSLSPSPTSRTVHRV